jgi:hypothetical protein
MARHAAPTPPRHALLRVGLTVTAAGAALGLGSAAAQAADAAPAVGAAQAASDAAGQALTGAVGSVVAGGANPVTNLQLDPLAKTSVDPLNNAVGTQVADFKPVSTALVTSPVSNGGALGTLPVTGQVTGLLPH